LIGINIAIASAHFAMPGFLRSTSKSTGAGVLCQPQFCGERHALKTRAIAGLLDEYLFHFVSQQSDAARARPSRIVASNVALRSPHRFRFRALRSTPHRGRLAFPEPDRASAGQQRCSRSIGAVLMIGLLSRSPIKYG